VDAPQGRNFTRREELFGNLLGRKVFSDVFNVYADLKFQSERVQRKAARVRRAEAERAARLFGVEERLPERRV
jgi:hypothetical protein